jgi:hypothetical protein
VRGLPPRYILAPWRSSAQLRRSVIRLGIRFDSFDISRFHFERSRLDQDSDHAGGT